MFTQQEKMAMLLAFEQMSPHDQIAIHALIHCRKNANEAAKSAKNEVESSRLLGSKFSRVKD